MAKGVPNLILNYKLLGPGGQLTPNNKNDIYTHTKMYIIIQILKIIKKHRILKQSEVGGNTFYFKEQK